MRRTGNGKDVCNFSIAADSGSGQYKVTTWFGVVVWGKTAEACAKYLDKGREVLVCGTPVLREFERKNGEKGATIEITADAFGGVTFVGSGKSDTQQEVREEKKDDFNYGPPPRDDGDDLPF
jgi:single-strand DNA-binding protein